MSADFIAKITSFFTTGPAFLIIVMVAMFAILIIPQRKREKKVKTMLASLKVGDRVRTIGGFFGRVVKIKDDVLTLEMGPDKVKLTITRGAISTIEDGDVENKMEEAIQG